MNSKMLVEDIEIVPEEELIANIMNNNFLFHKHYHPLKPQTHQKWSQSESRKYNKYFPKSWRCSEDQVGKFLF